MIAFRSVLAAVVAVVIVGVSPAAAQSLTGLVTHVRDGDTLQVAGVAVRLNGLHAPELHETGGREARRFMLALVDGQEIRCELTGDRSYDRQIGTCFVGGRDVAAALVAAGLGRDCPRFSGGEYAGYETAAGRELAVPGYCER